MPSIKRFFLQTRQGQIHVRQAGERATGHPPLVLVHPTPGSAWSCEPLICLLAPRRFVLAVDRPGCGESFRLASVPDMPGQASLLVEALDSLEVDVCDLAGQEDGACVAAAVAVLFAQRVRSVVVIDQDSEFGGADEWPPRPRADGGHLMDAWNWIMATSESSAGLEQNLERLIDCYRGGVSGYAPSRASTAHCLEDILPRLSQPQLMLANGVEDETDRLARRIDPKGLADRIVGFLGALDHGR